jgi:pimeloyl-ACP methyl ester carboxylesterase
LAPALGAEAPPTDAAAWMGVKGATAELVDEPVFNGHLMLYRAGARGGEPVVLVHGLGQNGARDWGRIVPALAPKYDVYALDLPGFGLSDKANELYSPENYIKVIDQVVARRIGRPFVLVGHSMGAAVSMGYAGTHPQKVKRLVLASMAGVLSGPVYAESLAKFGIGQTTGIPEGAPWLDAVLRRMMAKVESMPFSGDMVLRTPALRQKMLRGDPNLIAAFALGEHNFSEALRSVTAPTLLIWGSEDRIAPMRTAHLAASVIPGARLEVIPGAAHMPMLDDPNRFNSLLLEELAGRARPPVLPAGNGPIEGKAQSCADRSGARFSGDIPRLTLINCTAVQVNGARIGELRVLESDVTLVNTDVREGIYALRSRVTLTGGVVAGAPALRLQESDVDAAGTRFEPRGALAENLGDTPLGLRMSVAELKRGNATKYLHDTVNVEPRGSW